MASDAAAPAWLIVGVPDNRRTTLFLAALEGRQEAPGRVLDAGEALVEPWRLQAALEALGRPCAVRLDSPGEDFEVTRRLLAAGAAAAEAEGSPFLPPAALERLEDDRGLILHPRQWYLGLCAALRAWGPALAAPGVEVMNDPDEIAVMFDKVACQERLEAAGIPIPARLPGVASYDALVEALEAAGERRAFVKLAHGSSASGVIAYERGRRGQERATTSMERVSDGQGLRFYNSLRLSRFTTSEHIRDAVDAVCRERAQVELWVPKAEWDGQPFDLRVVVIGGEARHVVMRVGRSPMTNLHLGNARGDVEALRQRVAPDAWAAMLRTCERVAEVFPRSLYFGVDVALDQALERHWVLEVNAFGDLLPGVRWRGEETHAVEIDAMRARMASRREEAR